MLRAVLALVLIAFVAGVAFYAGRASTAGDHAAAPPVTPLPGVDPGTATTSAPAANVPPSGDTASRARTADVPAPPQLAPEPPSMQSPPVGDLPSSPPAAGAVTAASPSRPFEGNIASPIANLKGTDIRDMFEEARGAGERRHEAIDIMAPRGTPVLAVDSGIIKKLFTSKPGGLTVYQFDSRETVSYYYAHLDRYAAGLKEGVLVKRGDLIGCGFDRQCRPCGPAPALCDLRTGSGEKLVAGDAVESIRHALAFARSCALPSSRACEDRGSQSSGI